MSTNLSSRISAASEILDSYFPAKQILTDTLAFMGIDDTKVGLSVLDAKTTTYEDFVTALKTISDGNEFPSVQSIVNKPVPEPRLRLAWSKLQISGHDTDQKESNQDIISALRPIGQWTDEELLAKYNRDCPVEIEEELSKRAKGRPCIIFDGEIVCIELSVYMLRQARRRETPTTYAKDGNFYSVYKVGDFPLNILHECPVHSSILLVDGYCEECGYKWEDLDDEKLILIRLISESEKLRKPEIHTHAKMSFKELSVMYPKITQRFNDLKEEDRLPRLKRRISNSRNGDPLSVQHKTY